MDHTDLSPDAALAGVNHEPAVFIERRKTPDRRARGGRDLRSLFSSRRRRHVRRKSDRRRFHLLDAYPTRLLYFLVATLFLSCTDAALTLLLMDHGAVELNPIMAYYIGISPLVFLSIKYYLTSFFVIMAVLLNYAYIRFFGIRIEHMLKVFAGCFSCVVLWEVYLIYNYL